MKYTINIELDNNNFSDAVMHINNAKQTGYFDSYHVREMNSEYDGELEPIIVLTFESEANVTSMVPLIERWCKDMNQIYIAMQLEDKDNNTFGALIYDTNFRGHKVQFDSRYFLNN